MVLQHGVCEPPYEFLLEARSCTGAEALPEVGARCREVVRPAQALRATIELRNLALHAIQEPLCDKFVLTHLSIQGTTVVRSLHVWKGTVGLVHLHRCVALSVLRV